MKILQKMIILTMLVLYANSKAYATFMTPCLIEPSSDQLAQRFVDKAQDSLELIKEEIKKLYSPRILDVVLENYLKIGAERINFYFNNDLEINNKTLRLIPLPINDNYIRVSEDESRIFDSYTIREDNGLKKATYYIYKFSEDPKIPSKKMLEAFKTIQNIEAIKVVRPSNQGGIKIFKEKDGKLVEVDEQDKVIRVIE